MTNRGYIFCNTRYIVFETVFNPLTIALFKLMRRSLLTFTRHSDNKCSFRLHSLNVATVCFYCFLNWTYLIADRHWFSSHRRCTITASVLSVNGSCVDSGGRSSGYLEGGRQDAAYRGAIVLLTTWSFKTRT